MGIKTADGEIAQVQTPKQLSLGHAAVLQIIPGAASLPAFGILAYFFAGLNIPNMFALGITILFVEVPVSWALMLWRVKKEKGGRFSLEAAFPWTASIPWWQYLVIGFPIIIFSLIIIGLAGPAFAGLLLNSVFSWVPDWFVMRIDPGIFSSLSREMAIALWVLVLMAMVLVGGFTQELYARGFLLPRIGKMGNWAPAFNALLFAVFHLVAPWNWPAFFLMTLPWAYLVWWRRSVKIGIFIHVGMLALQWLGMTMLVFGLVPQQ